jgi:hypothetical protein
LVAELSFGGLDFIDVHSVQRKSSRRTPISIPWVLPASLALLSTFATAPGGLRDCGNGPKRIH